MQRLSRTVRSASAGASSAPQRNFHASSTSAPIAKASPLFPTGGSRVSSLTRRAAARALLLRPWLVRWRKLLGSVAEPSRAIPKRMQAVPFPRHSSTTVPCPCSRNWVSRRSAVSARITGSSASSFKPVQCGHGNPTDAHAAFGTAGKLHAPGRSGASIKWVATMVTYSDISPGEILQIKDLWERNRDFHISIESDFQNLYKALTFEERMEGVLADSNQAVKITTACSGGAVVGYCISALRGTVGELISMHVANSMRGQGVGKELATRHIRWLRDFECKEISLAVSPRNQQAIRFYERLGLRPCFVTMQLPQP
jgi:ribosomal protein S18 acetylase RimI-like enzyme